MNTSERKWKSSGTQITMRRKSKPRSVSQRESQIEVHNIDLLIWADITGDHISIRLLTTYSIHKISYILLPN